MTINEWVQTVHKNAVEKGWWLDKANPNLLEKICLAHSELSEAVESVRNGEPPLFQYIGDQIEPHAITQEFEGWDNSRKPEGALIELADAVIRIMDLCGAMGWDLDKAIELKHTYNVTRPFRHGNKRY